MWTSNPTLNPVDVEDAGDVDANGNPRRNQTVYGWGSGPTANLLATKTDASGNATGYYYNNLDEITQTVYSGVGDTPLVTDLNYQSSPYSAAIGDLHTEQVGVGSPQVRTTTFSVNPDGTLASVTGPGNNSGTSTTSFGYNANGTLKSETDPDGNVTQYGYPVTGTAANNYGYDASGQPLQILNAANASAAFGYDFLGNATSVTNFSGATGYADYDPFGDVTETVSPLGETSYSCYDTNGNQVVAVSPLSSVAATAACSLQGTDGYSTRSTYYPNDQLDYTVSTAQGQISETKNRYYPDGQLENVIEPRSFTAVNVEVSNPSQVAEVTATYYPDGRMASASNELQAASAASYTPDGQLATITAPAHDNAGTRTTTSYSYDGWGVTATQVSGDAGASVISHTLFGQNASTTTPNGNTTSYGYWPSGLIDTTTSPATTSDPNPTVATTNYDPAGNITSLVQPTGIGSHTTVNYTYTPLNEILTQSDPANAGHTIKYAYDSEGRQVDRYDLAAGVTQTTQATSYDLDGRTTTQTSSSTTGAPSFVASASYDAGGDVTAASSSLAGNPVSSISTSYTPEGLPATTAQTVTPPTGFGSPVTKQANYAYNNDGSLAAEGFGGVTSTYGYDLAGQETPTNPFSGGSFESTYYPSGDLASETVPNGALVADSYNASDLLSSELTSLAGSTLTAYSNIKHDQDGNVTSTAVTQQTAASVNPLGVTVPGSTYSGTATFGYDTQDRLDSYQGPLDSGPATFGIDDAGNVTSAGGTSYTYVANQLRSSASSAGTTSYSYDNQGNQTTISAPGPLGSIVTTTSYDAAFSPYQITSTTSPSAITNGYDALGRQAYVVTATGVSLYFYAGGSDQIEEEVDLSGGVVTGTTHYLLDSSGDPLGQNVTGGAAPGTSYDVFDPHGDVTQVLSSTGVVVSTYGYDPFGNPVASQTSSTPANLGPSGSKLGFQSAPIEPGTGEYAIGPRLYNPQIDRFAGADLYASSAAGLATQIDPLTGNSYLYAGANPANLIDDGYGWCPTGHTHGPNSACRGGKEVKQLITAIKSQVATLKAPTSPSAVIQDLKTTEGTPALDAGKGLVHNVTSTYDECSRGNVAHCALGTVNLGLQIGLAFATDGGSEAVEGALDAGEAAIEAGEAAGDAGEAAGDAVEAAGGATGAPTAGGTPIYRGVADDHFAFDQAEQGIAEPGDVAGHADPVLHNEGFTYNSQLTSWTTDPSVAEEFAGKNGVILNTTMEELQSRGVNILSSPDRFGESEILVQGRVGGLTVLRPPLP